MPQRTGTRVAVLACQENKFFVADFDDLGAIPDAQNARFGRFGGGPEGQAQIGVVDEGGGGGGCGRVERGQQGRTGWLGDEANRAKAKKLGLGDEVVVEFVGAQEHIGAGVAVEHEFPLAIGSQGDKGEGGAGGGIVAHAANVYACFGDGVGEHVPKFVIAHFADKGGRLPQFGHPSGDVGGGAARRFLKGGR